MEGYRRSGRSQREFAAEVGISVSALQLWVRKYAEDGRAGSRWAEVPNLLGQVHPAAYTVKLPDGASVEIRGGFRREELVCLLQTLRSV